MGIVTAYDNNKQSGEITDTAGNKMNFYYKDGQSLIYGNSLVIPQFSGHHDRPTGYALKVPAIGDAICFTKLNKGMVKVWGYVRHFIDLTERQYGTNFAT